MVCICNTRRLPSRQGLHPGGGVPDNYLCFRFLLLAEAVIRTHMHHEGHDGNREKYELRNNGSDQRVNAEHVQRVVVRNPRKPRRRAEREFKVIEHAALHQLLDARSQEGDGGRRVR